MEIRIINIYCLAFTVLIINRLIYCWAGLGYDDELREARGSHLSYSCSHSSTNSRCKPACSKSRKDQKFFWLSFDFLIEAKDVRGYTPLIWTSFGDSTDAAQLLLQRGADINAIDREGNTALIHARNLKNMAMISLLEMQLQQKWLDIDELEYGFC